MKEQLLLDVRHPVLRHHQVHGQHVLPGLAYIDLLFQTFRDHGHDYAGLELRHLSIYAPIVVAEDAEILLDIDATEDDGRRWRVVIDGQRCRHGVPTGQKTRYVTVDVHRAAPAVFDERIDPALVKAAAHTEISSEQIYQAYARRGLAHTGLMKPRGTVYAADGDLYAELSIADEALSSAASLMFHPALIDGAAVVVGGALEARSGHDDALRLPLAYESFRASALLQRACIARVRAGARRHRQEVDFLSLEFFDESGRKIAELQHLACRVVREHNAFAVAPAGQPSNGRGHREAPPVPGAGLEPFLRGLVADRMSLPTESIDRRRTFFEMGLDSAALLDLVRAIETKVTGTLSPTLLFEYTTIAELAAHLEQSSLAGRPQPAASPIRPAERSSEEVAIVGISGRFPGARTIEELWENLASGTDCITEIPAARWDPRSGGEHEDHDLARCQWGGFLDGIDEFDPLFFNIAPRDAVLVDPQCRLFLSTVWELLERSGYTRAMLQEQHRGKVGVYVGSMYQHYASVDADRTSAAIVSLSSYGAIANRTSHFLGVQGPSIAVDTMCSSAATAMHLACKDLAIGECELAIAGGVNLSIHPKKYIGLSRAQLTGTRATSRSFAEGDGYLPAEAVGAVLLKPLSSAVADGDPILAIVKSTGVNHGGQSNGYAVPNPNALARLIEETLAKAGADARTVTYVEAAANGSPTGDLIEMSALRKAFTGRASLPFCPIGSVKSNIGHAEAASAMSQLAKVVLQLQHGLLVPSIGAERANASLRLDEGPFRLQRALEPWPLPPARGDGGSVPRRALINSIGAGGASAAIVIEEYVPEPARTQDATAADGGWHLAVFSARTTPQLRAVVHQLLEYLEREQRRSLRDVIYTLQAGREAMDCRLAMIVASRDELLRGMRAYLDAGIRDTRISIPMWACEIDGDPTVDEFRSDRGGEVLARRSLEETELTRLARHWVGGGTVAWAALHAVACPRKVLLPTYPFARERYWLGAAGDRDRESTSHPEAPAAPPTRADAGAGAVRSYMTTFLAQALGMPAGEIRATKHLGLYGVDSILSLRLLRALEERFSMSMSVGVVFEHPTIESLSAYVEAHRPAAESGRDSGRTNARAIEALEQFRSGVLDHDALARLIEQGVFA